MKTPTPTDLLTVPLLWEAVFSETCSYRVRHEGIDVKLLINTEFPDKGPFYRLTVGDASIEFDDAPAIWTLPPPPS